MPDAKTGTATPELIGGIEVRYPAAAVPAITGVRLSPGETVTLVNISASGALVESTARVVPGTRVTVHFEGTITPRQINARVVRCVVSAIGSGGSLQYQSGIAFEGRMELPGDGAPGSATAVSPSVETATDAKESKTAGAAAPTPVARAYNRW